VRVVRSSVEAAKGAGVVFLAVPYTAIDAVLGEIGDGLASRVVINVTTA
jgi:predicted dinucleotide-binding enzyme